MLSVQQGETASTESSLLWLRGLWLWWVPALTSFVCEGMTRP